MESDTKMLDASLEEIIAAKRRRRPSAKARLLGPRRSVSAAAAAAHKANVRATAKITATTTSVTASAERIVVSNLPQDVSEAQIKELFSTTVGNLREVTLHYDAKGRSKGIAFVHFLNKGDGSKAYQQYNNRLIDGKRPMKIEIIVDPTRTTTAPPSLVARVAPAPAAAAKDTATPPATRGRGGKRGRGARGKKDERTPKSVADLDAEMEDYTANNAPAATA